MKEHAGHQTRSLVNNAFDRTDPPVFYGAHQKIVLPKAQV